MVWRNDNNKSGPPNLDNILGGFLHKIKQMFSGNNYSSNSNKYSIKHFVLLIIIILILLYMVLGFYIVKPAEQAAITRLGKYDRVNSQGPHWLPPFFEKKRIINTEKLERSSHYGSYMLTKDENILVI